MSENTPPVSRRPGGELRSALPGLTLLCANVLLGALMLGSFVWPAVFGMTPHQPAIATPTPTDGPTFDISAPPAAVSTSTLAPTTVTVIPSHATATPRASHPAPTATAIATPTPTPSVPTPTPLPVSPTPSPTVSSGG